MPYWSPCGALRPFCAGACVQSCVVPSQASALQRAPPKLPCRRDQRDRALIPEPRELLRRERHVGHRGAGTLLALQARDGRRAERRAVARLHEHARGLRRHLRPRRWARALEVMRAVVLRSGLERFG